MRIWAEKHTERLADERREVHAVKEWNMSVSVNVTMK